VFFAVSSELFCWCIAWFSCFGFCFQYQVNGDQHCPMGPCGLGRTTFLGHLLRDGLINPVKMFVHTYVRPYICTYVRTSTIKHNAATKEIVVFVRVDESFTTI